MATGISKHEQHGSDAVSALSLQSETIPLPSSKENVSLTYHGKVPENNVLTPGLREFLSISNHGHASPINSLPNSAFALSDNFFVLHNLLASNKKVTLFYLDPPYGTGMDFQSRNLEHAYKDNMGEATYIEFIRRRLILMRECLTEDGSIYVHIGHKMLGHLKIILDEIFGSQNFRNIITRRKCSSKNFTRKTYANLHDFILFYSKSKLYKWNQPTKKPDEEWIKREYPKIDDQGYRFKLVPVHAPGTRRGETGKSWKGMMPPPGKHWQYAPEKLDELDQAGLIHWSKNGNPRRRVYLPEEKTVPLNDYWENFRDAHHQSIKITGYPTEKNLEMIKTIVCASSNPGDLVVDPFCGSGTTMQAAHETNRDWIGVDSSFTAAKATLCRLRHGTKAMGDYVNGTSNKEGLSREKLALSANVSLIVDAKLWKLYYQEIEEISTI